MNNNKILISSLASLVLFFGVINGAEGQLAQVGDGLVVQQTQDVDVRLKGLEILETGFTRLFTPELKPVLKELPQMLAVKLAGRNIKAHHVVILIDETLHNYAENVIKNQESEIRRKFTKEERKFFFDTFFDDRFRSLVISSVLQYGTINRTLTESEIIFAVQLSSGQKIKELYRLLKDPFVLMH